MRKRQLCMICLPLLLWLALAGITGSGAPDASSRPWSAGDMIRVSGTVYRQEYKGNSQRIYLKNISVLSNASQNAEAVSEYTKKNILVYLKEVQPVEIGNRVLVSGICAYPSAPENPGGFDAYSYYSAMNIGMFLKKAVVCKRDNRVNVPGQFLAKLRKEAAESLSNICAQEDAGILSAMLLGDRDGLDGEMKELYQENGIIHVLAISGLHVSILGIGLYHLLRRLRLSFGQAALLAGGILWVYAVMTGGSYSTVRAVLMFAVFLGAQAAGRTYDPVTAWVAAAVFMLIWNQQSVTQAGFLLSFAAVAGVNLSLYSGHPLLRIKGLGVSAGVWLVTLPVTAWFYYKVSVYGIFLNLLAIPLMPVVLVSGAAGMAAGACSVKAGMLLAAPAHYVLAMIRYLCEHIRLLPGNMLAIGRPGTVQIVFYYLFLLIFLLFFKKKRKIDLLTGAFGIILIISMIFYKKPQEWTMTFLNVGQGDGCCIRTEEGSVWMVDGGSSDHQNLGTYTIQPYLEYHGISRVDYWLVSHYDNDHVSALVEILKGYQKNYAGQNAGGITVGHIVLPDTERSAAQQEKEGIYETITAFAAQNGIPVLYAGAGDVICKGETAFKVLAPVKQETYENSNAASMVVEVSYKGFRALLTGDVEGKGEQELLTGGALADIDVLKVAHHGSRNSTSEQFLQQVMPELSVISCGENNRYGHPHGELLERLSLIGSKVVRTDSVGAVDVIVTEQGCRAAKAG